MIQPTPADIGRRVVYSHRALKHRSRGVIVSVEADGRWAGVRYDGSAPPLKTGCEGLDWDDRPARPRA
jgi:hypothetical protein